MNRRARLSLALVVLLAALFAIGCGGCGSSRSGRPLRLATTTSVQDSGLLAILLPKFEAASGYKVEVQAVGSGKSLELLGSGAADVAITHAPDLEQKALTDGSASRRTPFMHNEYIIVGPKDEVTRVAGAGDLHAVMRSISTSGKKFISRGDGSGTNQKELTLWKAVGVAQDATFIVQAKAGMGETLKRASDDGAFTLADRGTFIAKRNDLDLAILFQGDPDLRNVYSLIEPKHADANADGARDLAAFVRSTEGRAVIGAFGVEKLGEPLFTPEP